MPSIVAKLAERDALSAEMASAATLHQIEINRRTIEAEIQEEIADWCGS